MTIEFTCPNCNKLLRTGDEKAGVTAKCPDCKTPITVPHPEEDFGVEEEEFGYEDDYGDEASEDYADQYGAAPPRAAGMKSCPMCGEKIKANAIKCRYCGEDLAGGGGRRRSGRGSSAAKSRVSGPAISLMVVAGLGIAIQLIGVVMNIIVLSGGGIPRPGGQQAQFIMMQGTIGLIFGAIEIIVGILIFIGALKMMKLQSHGFALTASILAMIPIISPCCLLGLPFGIWSIVVLSSQDVKNAFR